MVAGSCIAYHEAGDDAVEQAVLEAEALRVEDELLEVVDRLGHGGAKQADLHAAGRLAADADVEEDDVSDLGAQLGERGRHEGGQHQYSEGELHFAGFGVVAGRLGRTDALEAGLIQLTQQRTITDQGDGGGEGGSCVTDLEAPPTSSK